MAWTEGMPIVRKTRQPKVETPEQKDHRLQITRERKQRERDEMRIGHRVPGLQGHGARAKKEAIILETVVRRRCESCEQVFEAKVKDAMCLHCGLEVQTK